MEIYSGHEGKDRVCCSCGHNIRTPKKTYVDCNCDIDGHYIGYVQGFDSWCRHWTKGRNDFRGGKIAPNIKKWYYCYECHTWFLAEPATVVRCPHCGEDVTIQ